MLRVPGRFLQQNKPSKPLSISKYFYKQPHSKNVVVYLPMELKAEMCSADIPRGVAEKIKSEPSWSIGADQGTASHSRRKLNAQPRNGNLKAYH